MRLTKRQLKRIIREEYSKLKRRGLLAESAGAQGTEQDPFKVQNGKIIIEDRPGAVDPMGLEIFYATIEGRLFECGPECLKPGRPQQYGRGRMANTYRFDMTYAVPMNDYGL